MYMLGKYMFGLFSILLTLAVWNQAQTQQKPGSHGQAASATPARDVKVTYGPHLQKVTDTSAAITWSTSASTDTVLRYSTNAGHLDQVARSPLAGTVHRVELKNLLPGTIYYYRVDASASQAAEAMHGTATFKTKPVKK